MLINWTDVFWVAAATILLYGFVLSKNKKNRLSVGTVLIILGAIELALVILAYVDAFQAEINPHIHFIPDYYGQAVFLPLIIVLAIVSVAYGIRVLLNQKVIGKS